MDYHRLLYKKNINNWLRISTQKKHSRAEVYFDDNSAKNRVLPPVFAGKIGFCRQKPIFAGKNYFCQSGFYRGKNGFFHLPAKTCQPWFIALRYRIFDKFEI